MKSDLTVSGFQAKTVFLFVAPLTISGAAITVAALVTTQPSLGKILRLKRASRKSNLCLKMRRSCQIQAKPEKTRRTSQTPPFLGQNCSMNSHTVNGPYRVRAAVRHEKIVPEEVPAFHFKSSVAAHSYARQLASEQKRPVVIEKLAPSGCWLQLTTLG